MSAAGRTPSRSLFEREGELAVLHAALTAAASGDGRLVVIEGGIGIGKTRLLREAQTLAADMGLRSLHARGGELERDFAFGAVRQLFEPVLAEASPVAREQLLSGAAALAEPVFVAPQLGERTEGLTDASFIVLHGLYWLAANLAFERPTVLGLDDIHWFDAPSLRWLAYLARRIDGLPLVIVATARTERAAAESPPLAELIADPQADVLRPTALGHASTLALASELFGLEPDESFGVALDQATGGNPLFVRALLDAILHEAIPPTAEQAVRLHDLAAEGVNRLVGLRLARLPADATRLGRAIAILGDEADISRAAELAQIEPDLLHGAVEALAGSGLVAPEASLEFSHPIVRSAVLDGLGAVERARLHREAAEILFGTGAHPELVGAHLLHVPRGADPFVVEALRDAASSALGQGATDSAIAYLTRALEEQAETRLHLDVLVELGIAERRTRGEAAVEHLGRALASVDEPKHRGELALEYARALFFSGRTREAIAALADALERVPREEFPDLAERLEAELIGAAWWEPDTYPIAASRLANVQTSSLQGGLGTDLLLAGLSTYECRLARDRPRAVELARNALASGTLENAGAAAFAYAATTFLFAGEFAAARAHFSRAAGAARRRGDVIHLAALSLLWHGRTLAFQGDLASAATDLREALDLADQHRVELARPYIVGFLGDVLREQGQLDAATELVDGAELGESLPRNTHFMFFRLSRARLRLATGSLDQALQEAIDIGETVTTVPSDNPAFVPWRAVAVEALQRLGRVDEAVELAEEELALARGWGAAYAIGAALRGVARAEPEKAEQHLREAIVVLSDSGARLEHAHALVDLGATIRRANRRKEAREPLRRGVDLAHTLGAVALAQRGNDEIAATGSRPRKQLLTGLDALTASERRVAQLAADGLTNRDIAQALFVTVKTVELHLSSTYRKLDIHSRSELATALVSRRAR